MLDFLDQGDNQNNVGTDLAAAHLKNLPPKSSQRHEESMLGKNHKPAATDAQTHTLRQEKVVESAGNQMLHG